MSLDDIQEIDRGCSKIPSENESWMQHKSLCSIQPLNGGKDEFCYCSSDFCNSNSDNLTSTCDLFGSYIINNL